MSDVDLARSHIERCLQDLYGATRCFQMPMAITPTAVEPLPAGLGLTRVIRRR